MVVLGQIIGILALLSTSLSAHKIAVIGGGISGSFIAKYLADYDTKCQLDSITVFEPQPVTGPLETDVASTPDQQGSRVSSLRLEDGTIVELGASIFHKTFYHLVDMISGDPDLKRGEPFHTGNQSAVDPGMSTGFGIYNGSGDWSLITSGKSSFWQKMILLYRYNFELTRMTSIIRQFMKEFRKIPSLLQSEYEGTFFHSPDELWDAVGMKHAVHSSFDALLDVLGFRRELSAWRKWIPFQGSLRTELLTAVNLVNYNQDNTQVNGMVGLGSFVATSGGLFSIIGGNCKIIQSAFRQASNVREARCARNDSMTHVAKRVTTVIGGMEGLSLYSGEQSLGRFDIVVLAVPLQHSGIEFVVQSQMDEAVLQPMPMAGLIDAHETATDEGHRQVPHNLPPSAERPYTQVVTTIVSNATLSSEYFYLSSPSKLPASIFMTTTGKASLHNITTIRQIKSSSGVYKVFSNEILDQDVLAKLFGAGYKIEYTKMWGGPRGGATPAYHGQGGAPNFLLYDGAIGLEGYTRAGALYYPPAMEQSSLSCVEICAMGAKAVAKLIALRVGLLTQKRFEARDEL